MKIKLEIILLIFFMILLTSFNKYNDDTYSLTIEVDELRNSKGVVQFALYNKDGTLPDENYVRCYRISIEKIINNSSVITFKNLTAGMYAVNILHDENINGKIDRALVFPKEGIGFSNYQSIGLTNIPKFSKASFNLEHDFKIKVKIIYM